MAENIREIVLDILLVLEKEADYSNRLIKAVLDKYDYLDSRDKAFIKRVSEGTVERKIELDYYLNSFSSVSVSKMKPLVRCILRMSVYQLLYMDQVPDSAVCNEACKLAVKRRFGNLRGFINGVLRNIARNREQLPTPDPEKEPVRYYSVKYSMPEWIIELWLEEYGMDRTAVILKGLLEIHPVSLRLRSDLTKDSRDRLLTELETAGAGLKRSRYLPYSFVLEHADNLSRLPGFFEGLWTVQDVSSALAVEVAEIQKTDVVLDACAAPGGKSILAAEKALRVISRDLSEDKAEFIRENVRRMKAENVEVQVWDATWTDEALINSVDVLLLDVPCSGLGILGKKRDIKYHVSPEGLKSLVRLQQRIVMTCYPYVKPGGTLIYSTCTIHSAENEQMVRFICEKTGFEPVSIKNRLPEALAEDLKKATSTEKSTIGRKGVELTDREKDACVQLLPGFTESDGFFIAKFRRPLPKKDSIEKCH